MSCFIDFFVLWSLHYRECIFGENACQEIVRKAMQWSMSLNKIMALSMWNTIFLVYLKTVFIYMYMYMHTYIYINIKYIYIFYRVVKTRVIMYFLKLERGFSSLILTNIYVTLHAQQGLQHLAVCIRGSLSPLRCSQSSLWGYFIPKHAWLTFTFYNCVCIWNLRCFKSHSICLC